MGAGKLRSNAALPCLSSCACTCLRLWLDLPVMRTLTCLLSAAVQYNNPQETYNYYYLPFCKPVGAGKAAHKWGGLGEVLEGNQLIDSQLDVKYRCESAGGPQPCGLPCSRRPCFVHENRRRAAERTEIYAAVLVMCSGCAKEDHLHAAAGSVGGRCIRQCSAQALLVRQRCMCPL